MATQANGHTSLTADGRPRPPDRTARSSESENPARQRAIRYAVAAYGASWFLSSITIWLLRAVGGVRIPAGPRALIVDTCLAATLFVLYRGDELWVTHLGLLKPPLARSIVFVLRISVALVVIDGLLSAFTNEPKALNPLRGIATASLPIIVITGFAAAITAPVMEEMFFRGFLYRRLRTRLPKLLASVIDGAMFAVVHTHYRATGLAAAGVFGVAACLLYEQTGSILPGVALHSFIDATGFEVALTGDALVVPSIFVFSLLGMGLAAAIKQLVRWREAHSPRHGACD